MDVGDNILYFKEAQKEALSMKYDSLSLDRLKELLNYDSETGVFTWKMRPVHNSRKLPGDVAGTKKGKGYLYIGIDSRTYVGSQLAWFYHHGVWPKGQIGMKDKKPSNLCIENLYEMRTADGRHDFETREGMVAYRKAYKDANPLAHRGYGFKRYYGISIEDYQQMFLSQNGVCAICENPETAKTSKGTEVRWLSVDHCHTTGNIRGLLCNACNHVLGESKDDPVRLRKAAEYLEKSRSNGGFIVPVTARNTSKDKVA